jgi:hypothetical protein
MIDIIDKVKAASICSMSRRFNGGDQIGASLVELVK